MSKIFSQSDVAAHTTTQDLWIIVDEDVYDLTKFQDEHPGQPERVPDHRLLPGANALQVVKRVCRSHSTSDLSSALTTASSPSASGRQGRLEAVLEIPQ